MDIEQVYTFFNSHNRSRIERLCELAPAKQQLFLQLLPLIFQSNDAALPGYVENAPFGIVDYQPSDALLASAKKQYASFSYTKHSFREYPLQGLYLINEAGALSYSKSPKFALWIVYSSHNTDEQTQLLKAKLQQVISFAKSIGITLNARLLNDTAVKEHKVLAEDLDRLYSCGLVLAGCVPLWWFISPQQEADYLSHSQAVTAAIPATISILDFGPLGDRSASSLVSMASSASLDAMEHGLPCYLDLFFYQTLLDHHPDNLWLSTRYKQTIYSEETNAFYSEPFILKFELLADKLSYELGLFLRRSLYLSVDERLSIKVSLPKHVWRREALADLVDEWQWEQEQLLELDQRNQAHIRTRLDEFNLTKQLTGQLNDSIAELVKTSAPEGAKKLVTLQKAYQDIFDTPPDVIPRLPLSLIPEVAEDNIFLEHEPSSELWVISEMDKATLKKGEKFKKLHSDVSLVQTLAWAIINGALANYSRIKVQPNTTDISNQTIYTLLESLLKSPLASVKGTDETLNWLMFANVEKTPEEAYKQQDMKLALHLRDPLNYSYHRRNIVLSIDVLTCADNKNWHYFKYDQKAAATEAMANFIRWHSDSEQTNFIDCWCPTPHFDKPITKRLVTLATDISNHFKQSPNNGTYILEVADRLNRIQWQQQNVDTIAISSKYTIDNLLGQARTELSLTQVDTLLDNEGLYGLLLKEQAKHQVRLFINVHKSDITVYILDELGHLFKQAYNGRELTVLANLTRFLSDLTKTNGLDAPKIYKLKDQVGSWTQKPLALDVSNSNDDYLPVRVKMKDAAVDAACSILCGNKRFDGKANDPALLQQVAQFVLQLRKTKENYPLYISDIYFDSDKKYNSYHYISYKQRFERILNIK